MVNDFNTSLEPYNKGKKKKKKIVERRERRGKGKIRQVGRKIEVWWEKIGSLKQKRQFYSKYLQKLGIGMISSSVGQVLYTTEKSSKSGKNSLGRFLFCWPKNIILNQVDPPVDERALPVFPPSSTLSSEVGIIFCGKRVIGCGDVRKISDHSCFFFTFLHFCKFLSSIMAMYN